MKLYYFGHACFKLCTDEGSVVLDPYGGELPGLKLPELYADLAVASHEHWDHNAVQLVKLSGKAPSFTLRQIGSYHDSKLGLLRGKNQIALIESEGLRLAHLGDLGHELSAKQLKELGEVDVLLVPVGGHYTIDANTAKRVAESLNAKIIIPMHYREGDKGLREIAELSDFCSLYPQDQVHLLSDSCMDIDAQTPAGVYALKL